MDEIMKERLFFYFGAIAILALIFFMRDTLVRLFSKLGILVLFVGWLLAFAILEILRKYYGFGIFGMIGKESDIPDRSVKLAIGAVAVIVMVQIILILMWFFRSQTSA